MKPTFKIELQNTDIDIERGSLVISKARLGQVLSLDSLNLSTYAVFSYKTANIEAWPKESTKLFRGKLIIKQ